MAGAAAGRLRGKTVLITGASSGIGRSTAFEFARTSPEDVKLVLVARRVDRLTTIAKKLTAEFGTGFKIFNLELDVSDPSQASDIVNRLPAEFADVDVLVNNARVIDYQAEKWSSAKSC